MTVKTISAARLLAGTLLLGFTASVAMAAPTGRAPTKVADAALAQPAAALIQPAAALVQPAATLDDGTCSRSRKRLWVDGEGWIVRRVTTCH